jgi:hypothetical protein
MPEQRTALAIAAAALRRENHLGAETLLRLLQRLVLVEELEVAIDIATLGRTAGKTEAKRLLIVQTARIPGEQANGRVIPPGRRKRIVLSDPLCPRCLQPLGQHSSNRIGRKQSLTNATLRATKRCFVP